MNGALFRDNFPNEAAGIPALKTECRHNWTGKKVIVLTHHNGMD